MRTLWARWQGWARARTRRERALLLGAVGVTLLALWLFAVHEPLAEARDERRSDAERLAGEAAELQARAAELEEALAEAPDPEAEAESRLERLEARRAEIETALADEAEAFMGPEELRGALRALLPADGAVRIVRFRTAGSEALEARAGEAGAPLYRHSVELEFSADFIAAVAYLEELEGLEGLLLWEGLEYRVTDHPRARVRVRLGTVTDVAGWLDA